MPDARPPRHPRRRRHRGLAVSLTHQGLRPCCFSSIRPAPPPTPKRSPACSPSAAASSCCPGGCIPRYHGSGPRKRPRPVRSIPRRLPDGQGLVCAGQALIAQAFDRAPQQRQVRPTGRFKQLPGRPDHIASLEASPSGDSPAVPQTERSSALLPRRWLPRLTVTPVCRSLRHIETQHRRLRRARNSVTPMSVAASTGNSASSPASARRPLRHRTTP